MQNGITLVVGATGNVGGMVARKLLRAGRKVRVLLRAHTDPAPWRALGAEV
ncbi:MAG TPA: NmrA family NAD(P)-binding protein, partial [Candidatus Thermoplasmatota archaeon]|nr:NmrA family NAD(P)-binding protein [Candidatus Thermoplasmatota archaeon]